MIYSVIVDISASEVDRIFDYEGQGYTVGSRVLVNFANRQTEGYIVEEKLTTDCPPEKLKSILRPLDDYPVISQELLQLGAFMRKEYHLKWVDVLRLFIPAEMRGNRVKELVKKQAVLTTENLDEILSSLKPNATKQRDLVTFLHANGATLCEKLNNQFGNSALKALVEKGFVEARKEGRGNCYTPLITREDYLASQSRRFVDQLCGGSMSVFANALCDSGLTREELDELRRLLKEGAL